jgi:hypothetical protein
MGIERNQLASVGRLYIWSLSDALPEKEVFQSARIYRDGITKPILAETLDRSISQHSQIFLWQAMRALAACSCGLQKAHQLVQVTAYSDRCHR